MIYQALADLVVVLHAAFVIFAVAGGLLVLRWFWVAWIHIPAAAWAALIEFADWDCPLTPLENHFRAMAGQTTYDEGFIARYILPVLYPGELTPEIQIGLGLGVLIVNAVIYWRVVRKWRRQD